MMKKILIFLVLLLSAQCVCAEGSVEKYINDTFDTVNEYDFDGSNGYFPVIIDNAFGNGAPSRKIPADRRMICNIPEIRNMKSGVVAAEADFCLQSAPDRRGLIASIFDGMGNVKAAGLYSERNYLYFDCFDENGEQITVEIGTFFPGEWFNFAYSVNLSSREIKLYFDGERIISDSKVYADFTADNLCRFLNIDRRGTSGDMWIDNLCIYRDDFDAGLEDNYQSDNGVIAPITDSDGNEILWDKTFLKGGMLRARAILGDGQARTYFLTPGKLNVFGRRIENGEYTADVHAAGGEQLTAVIASYEADGRLRSMRSVRLESFDLTEGFNDLSVFTDDTGADYYKGFLWDGILFTPLGKAVFKMGAE